MKGYKPAAGTTFEIMDYNSVTGGFATVNSLNDKFLFDLTYQPHDLLLTVERSSAPIRCRTKRSPPSNEATSWTTAWVPCTATAGRSVRTTTLDGAQLIRSQDTPHDVRAKLVDRGLAGASDFKH